MGKSARPGRADASYPTPERESGAGPLVVHLLPAELPRGAQVYAHEIRNRLDGHGTRHRVMTLFESEPGFSPDFALDLPKRQGPFRMFDPRAAIRLRRLLQRLEPDVLVAHGGEPLKYAALAKPRTTKLVYLKIGTSSVQLRSRVRRYLYRLLVGRCDLVAAVSQQLVAEAADLLEVPLQRIAYVPNGRDPARFQPARHGAHLPVRLCFVGRLTRTKRPERFIELVRYLQQQGMAVSAVMIGSGPLEDELGPAARSAHVEMMGARNDVPEILAQSDALVFTSVVEGEGMPGVLIEAGLAGLPAVSTDVPGARDVIDDGATGLIVPVDDFAALAAATAHLVGSPESRARMGRAARERCVEHFTLDASARTLNGLLESLIARR